MRITDQLQATEREQEREEWDRKLALASASRRSSKVLSRGESVENEEEEEGHEDDEVRGRVGHMESELNTAVDKIFELRDIIRGLEARVEAGSLAETKQTEVIQDLRLGLEEALLSQQLVSQELELLRSSTSDQVANQSPI